MGINIGPRPGGGGPIPTIPVNPHGRVFRILENFIDTGSDRSSSPTLCVRTDPSDDDRFHPPIHRG
jgi:hypothetical protein